MGSNPGPCGGPGPLNMLGGQFTGRTFPEWGDPEGNSGNLVVLRMEAATGSLPKAPFLLRKSVEAYLGVPIDGAFPEAKGTTYVLKLRNNRLVERLKQMNQLADGTAIKIAEHPTLNKTKVVISCQETVGYTDDELKDELLDQGVVDLRRITRLEGRERVNTATVILTISGTVAPNHIEVGWLRCRTRPYYPSPMLCFGCYKFGHTKARCQQQTPVCGNCSGNHHSDRETPCNEAVFCSRCQSSQHSLSSRKCPEYKVEEDIQRLRVDLGISYPAAKRTFEQRKGNTYASVAKGDQEKKIEDLATKLDRLQQDMTSKDSKIDALIQQIEARDLDIKKRDARIEQLESLLRLEPQERLSTVKEYGTIQDLLRKVKDLEQDLTKKNKEIATLRKVYTPGIVNTASPTTTPKTKAEIAPKFEKKETRTSNGGCKKKPANSNPDTAELNTPTNSGIKKKIPTQDSPKTKRQKNDETSRNSETDSDDNMQIFQEVIEVDYDISSNDEIIIDGIPKA